MPYSQKPNEFCLCIISSGANLHTAGVHISLERALYIIRKRRKTKGLCDLGLFCEDLFFKILNRAVLFFYICCDFFSRGGGGRGMFLSFSFFSF